jgi:DNA modification methylase
MSTITVLGKTFNSEEERRVYFRAALREKLPELKKMEGFPIGEDDDILNLSDPPYYTACPNPWLNDFIAQWESKKEELEQKGIRQPDFKVEIPYASDVSVGKNNPVYKAHSYVTKVPHPAIMRYILHYTQPEDIVFDGFSGTGMTGVAAQLCEIPPKSIEIKINSENEKQINWGNRNFIGNDLSVLAGFIANHYNNKIFNTVKFRNDIEILLSQLKEKYGWIYETIHSDKKTVCETDYIVWSDKFICNNCSNEIIYWDAAVNNEESKINDYLKCKNCDAISKKRALQKVYKTVIDRNGTKKVIDTVPVLIKYSYRGKSYLKKPDEYDFKKLEEIRDYEITLDYAIKRMPIGGETRRNDKNGLKFTDDFFTKRNLIVLTELYHVLEYDYHIIFTALLNRATKLNCTVMSNYFKQLKGNTVGGWAGKPREGTLYLPSISTEVNILKTIKSRLSSIIKLKTYISNFKINTSVINTASSSNTSLLDNSVDYIFTDPPFGANRAYSELNFITEDWLNVITNNKEEAIENRVVNKSLIDYFSLMNSCFTEFHRILKPGKWMTVEFSNTNSSVWNGIQTSIQKAGFVISNVSALDKKQGSIQAVTTPTAVKQDLIISCYKPSSKFDEKFQQHQYSEVAVWDFVEEHLEHLPVHLEKDNSTTAIIERNPKILFDRLIAFYVQRGLPVPIDAGNFQKGLRERFIERDGMFFMQEQAAEYDVKKQAAPNFVQLSLLVSSEQDGVLWLRNLLETKSLAYQDIQPQWMQALAGVRKGDMIPELMSILEENFLKDDKGKWYLPDVENEIDLEKLRTKRLLKQFDGYKELALKPKGKLKEVRVEALRAGFKHCYQTADFKLIVLIGDKIPNNLLMEDEVLLQFYDIATNKL